jgi:hypothetical protein
VEANASPGPFCHATVLVFIPADGIEEGSRASKIVGKKICTDLRGIRFTLLAVFGVYSYQARPELPSSFRDVSEKNCSST